MVKKRKNKQWRKERGKAYNQNNFKNQFNFRNDKSSVSKHFTHVYSFYRANFKLLFAITEDNYSAKSPAIFSLFPLMA